MSAPITEELITQALNTGGWGALENLAEKAQGDLKTQMQGARNEAAIVGAVLSTPEGMNFLHWLIGKTLLRPPGEQELGARTAESYAIAKARREGQNGVMFMILQALEVAREGRQ